MFWRFFGDASESCFEVVFFENFLGGAAEDHLKCKKRSGIHSDRALLLNALPVPLLRQVGGGRAPSDGKRFCDGRFGA